MCTLRIQLAAFQIINGKAIMRRLVLTTAIICGVIGYWILCAPGDDDDLSSPKRGTFSCATAFSGSRAARVWIAICNHDTGECWIRKRSAGQWISVGGPPTGKKGGPYAVSMSGALVGEDVTLHIMVCDVRSGDSWHESVPSEMATYQVSYFGVVGDILRYGNRREQESKG
jgi:hypothetical protein